MVDYRVTIEDIPIVSSKNSKRMLMNRKTGKLFVAKSATASACERSLRRLFKEHGERIDCECPVVIYFFFIRSRRNRFDYVNMCQIILDSMVKEEVIPDDSADYVVPYFMPYACGDRDITLVTTRKPSWTDCMFLYLRSIEAWTDRVETIDGTYITLKLKYLNRKVKNLIERGTLFDPHFDGKRLTMRKRVLI